MQPSTQSRAVIDNEMQVTITVLKTKRFRIFSAFRKPTRTAQFSLYKYNSRQMSFVSRFFDCRKYYASVVHSRQ